MQVADELQAIQQRLHDTHQLSAGVHLQGRGKQGSARSPQITARGQQADRQAAGARSAQSGQGQKPTNSHPLNFGLLAGLTLTGQLGTGSYGTVYSGVLQREYRHTMHS